MTATGKKPPTTLLFVELTTGEEGVGIQAHRWSQIFEKLDVTLTIRRAHPDDKPETVESKRGESLRQVRILGRIDAKGQVVFADRVFSDQQVAALAEWLDELRVYGAQGTPEGQPAWGLTKQQFGVIHEALSKPVTRELLDVPLSKALAQIELPEAHALQWTDQARRLLQEAAQEPVVAQPLRGIAQGTALALLLRDAGLGYRPRRNPDGSIDLAIVSLAQTDDVWPVGWPREAPAPTVAPGLFEFKLIEFDELELDAVLQAAAEVARLSVLIDRRGLAEHQIDLASVPITYPVKRTTWAQALPGFLHKAGCKHELLLDEQGRPFIWVTPLKPTRAAQR